MHDGLNTLLGAPKSRRGSAKARPERMGCKDGTSANAGRTASVYEAEAPDGTMFRKRSYQVHTDVAVAMIYEHNGTWYIAGITNEIKKWPGQISTKARKVR